MKPFKERCLNIDSGNKCTLGCAACQRTVYKKSGRSIPGKDLTPLQFDKLTNYFNSVLFCGTFSDPIFNPYFIDILKICKRKKIRAKISTAASHKPEHWYVEAFDAYKEAVWMFGIDGLPKDSHKYRIHQEGMYLFDMMLLAKYRGIPVEWQYIVFDYNKDDINEAKKLAKLHKIPLVLLFSKRNAGNKIDNIKNEKQINEIITKNKAKVLYKSGPRFPKERKLNPKCLLTSRDLSFSNTGHIMPCCWMNTSYTETGVKELFNDKHYIDNNNSVEDIIESDDWKKFFDVLKNNPSKAPFTCKSFCSGALNNDPEETRVRI